MALLAHVICASLVQVCDYASDMLVAYTLIWSQGPLHNPLAYIMGHGILYAAAFSASIAMVFFTPLMTFMEGEMGARCSSLDGHLPTKEHSGSGVFWAEEPFLPH